MVSSRRRQQRRELKEYRGVAGPVLDAGQVLLKLNDGKYSAYDTGDDDGKWCRIGPSKYRLEGKPDF
jgi:hypothetical protein